MIAALDRTEPITLTWRQLLGEVRVFAAALIAAGIEPGDRVAIWAPNSYHWPIAALGTHYAGAALVPLNTRYTISEAAEIIDRADARVVVTVDDFVGTNRLADLLGHPVRAGRTVIGIGLDGSGTMMRCGGFEESCCRFSCKTARSARRRTNE